MVCERWAGMGRERVCPPLLTSGCLRRMCLLMEALVDTLVPHSWQLCASTLSCVSCTCFCSIYSVTYFLSHTEHVHCLPTAHAHGEEDTSPGHQRGRPATHGTGGGTGGPGQDEQTAAFLPEHGVGCCSSVGKFGSGHWRVQVG